MKTNKKKLSIGLILIASLMYFGVAYAHSEYEDNEISAFRSFKDLSDLTITVPTVIEVSFSGEYMERNVFAVHENESDSFQPYFFDVKNLVKKVSTIVSSIPRMGVISNLIDGKYDTFVDYPLPETHNGKVEFSIKSERMITVSSVNVVLDRNVAMPTFVEIHVIDNGKNRIVLARKRMLQSRVTFPKTTARDWIIKLEYVQPLRISELQLIQEDVENSTEKGLRFLARPKENYRIYFNPDRSTDIKTGEAGNLRDDKEVLRVLPVLSQENDLYKEADVDGDGVSDKLDNCVYTSNKEQIDSDKNNRGDACDDFDKDGVINSKDNCPNHPNRRQADEDGDGIGDACDGEESRLTEKYTWLPWVGMTLVAVIVFILFFITIKGIREKDTSEFEE